MLRGIETEVKTEAVTLIIPIAGEAQYPLTVFPSPCHEDDSCFIDLTNLNQDIMRQNFFVDNSLQSTLMVVTQELIV